MHRFDYSFLKKKTPGTLINISSIIYDLRSRDDIRKKQNGDIYDAMQKNAIIDSVRSSNAIEGIVTTEKRLREMTDGEQEPVTHDEYEIMGYKNVLNEIFTDYKNLDITEKNICHFHSVMMSAESMDAGHYKTEDNWIQERNSDGRIKVRFVPVSASETKEAMEQMIMAYHEARQDSEISRLLLISCVILDFLCIHPFADGNGRVSRLLTILMLQRGDFDIGRYVSIENKINEHKAGYYDALRKSSEGWQDNLSDYAPFMTYMLQILYACYKQLDESFIKGQTGKVSKSNRIENIMANAYVPVSKEEICARVPDISVTTVERVIGKMVRDDKIIKIGTYKDARYKVKA